MNTKNQNDFYINEKIKKELSDLLGEKIINIELITSKTLSNYVYRLLLENKTKLVLRVFKRKSSDTKYLKFYPEIQESLISLEVPIPKEITRGTIRRYFFVIQQFVEGDATNHIINLKNMDTLLNQLGKHLKNIHQIKGQNFGFISSNLTGTYSTWIEFLLNNIKDNSKIISYSVKNNLITKQLLISSQNIIKRIYEKHIIQPSLLHGDYKLSNTLSDGKNITAILDWDQAKLGDPMYDFANYHLFKDTEICVDDRSFYRGYFGRDSIPQSYLERFNAMKLWLSIYHMGPTHEAGFPETSQRLGKIAQEVNTFFE